MKANIELIVNLILLLSGFSVCILVLYLMLDKFGKESEETLKRYEEIFKQSTKKGELK